MKADPVAIALRVSEAFEACGLQYLVGGSVASSLSGEPRSTLDLDMVVGLTEADVPCLLRGWAPNSTLTNRRSSVPSATSLYGAADPHSAARRERASVAGHPVPQSGRRAEGTRQQRDRRARQGTAEWIGSGSVPGPFHYRQACGHRRIRVCDDATGIR